MSDSLALQYAMPVHSDGKNKGERFMYAVEFEASVTSPFIMLQNYEQFMNQQVKVIVLAQDTTNIQADHSFSVLDLSSFNKGRKKQSFSRMDAYDDAI